jgi:hypothetical protein
MPYSAQERAEIVSIFIGKHYSIAATQIEWRRRHGRHAATPSRPTIYQLHRKFLATGSCKDRQRGGRPSVTHEQVAAVEEAFARDPHHSQRRLSQELNISRSTVRKIARKVLQLFPYRIRKHCWTWSIELWI